ncbi:MAG: hypothetical protein OXF28_04655 [Thaumarchaeota archaeon]|nr:hypothetical protein [Nitrososphaerota archaeon]MCY3976395.1 hypothetical protein [Nitrososphaerota archaeon]
MKWYKIKMKFAGKCITCGLSLPRGEEGFWAKDVGIKHKKCFEDKPINCIICNNNVDCNLCEFANYCDRKTILQCACENCRDVNNFLDIYKKSLHNIKI